MSKKYLKRIVDTELDELLPQLPAISLEGPKGVGKTETARRRAETVHELDDPAQRSIVEADPSRVLAGNPPILIDEWQRVPAVWDVVRRAVDEGVHLRHFCSPVRPARPTPPPTPARAES